MNPSRCLVVLRPVPRPSARLICFPYSGGSAAVFRTWARELPADIELVAVQLRGRGTRFAEPPSTQIEGVLEELEPAMRSLADRPFAFFGHSLGSAISFALAQRLRDRGGPLPFRLFLSARQAPHVRSRLRSIRGLDDRQLIAQLREWNGTPEEVLRQAELMELLLPLVRADFTLSESFSAQPDAPLAIPFTVLGGRAEFGEHRHELDAWAPFTSADCQIHIFDGDHFYINTATTPLLALVSQQLRTTPAGASR